MGSMDSRLKRLEEVGASGRCSECGLTSDERRPIAVIRDEYPGRSFEGDPYEVCADCKEPLHTVIRVVYGDPPADEEGGGEYRWP